MVEPFSSLDVARRTGLAIAMALFMGLAFEGVYKHEERTSPGGIRTFPTLAMLGTALYLIEPKSLTPYLLGLAAVAAWLYAYVRSPPLEPGAKPGLMVPAANLLAYAFGALALTQPAWIVVGVAVAAVLLLEGRESLHRLVSKVPSDEVFTLGKFLILVGVVLPLLPNRPIVSWTPITPFHAWLALVAISSLSYSSYLMQRYVPSKSAILVPALLGGAYSSTAATVALARARGTSALGGRDLETGIVLATAVMYLRIDAIIAVFNGDLAVALLPSLAVLFALAGIIAAWQWLAHAPSASSPKATLASKNPLQLGVAALFAGLFILLAVASTWVGATYGQRGIYTLAAVTGFTDIDPFVLSLAQGSVAGMSVRGLGAAVLIAASSNNVLKACYALVFGGLRSCLRPALALLALAAIGVALALIYY
jgi:uncharacterized membrane protein (DUF4010 family)